MINLTTVILIFLVMLLIKNENAFRQREKIIDAIYGYAIASVEYTNVYSDMEDYSKTLFRLWDWGYTNIVPPDVLEKIKPYIKE